MRNNIFNLLIKILNTFEYYVSSLFLLLIFIFLILPIALFLKLMGYDPLRKRYNYKKTYREKIRDNKIDLSKLI